MAHTKWGADRQTLLKLYRALVRSQLDYGSFIYTSARKTYIKKPDPIHHEGLRLVLGAFKTSPVDSPYTEAHEAPLQLRSEKLALQYCIKLKSCPSNPAYDCIFQSKYKQPFEQKESTIKPFGLRMEPILKESTISVAHLHKSIITQTPPWIIKKPKVILQSSELPKTKTHPSTYIEKFHTIILTTNIYSQTARRITIKQRVQLFSIKQFSKKAFLRKAPFLQQKSVPLTLL